MISREERPARCRVREEAAKEWEGAKEERKAARSEGEKEEEVEGS
jgi:hypothetical protein